MLSKRYDNDKNIPRLCVLYFGLLGCLNKNRGEIENEEDF